MPRVPFEMPSMVSRYPSVSRLVPLVEVRILRVAWRGQFTRKLTPVVPLAEVEIVRECPPLTRQFSATSVNSMVWVPGATVRDRDADSAAVTVWEMFWSRTIRYPFGSGKDPVVSRVIRIVEFPVVGGRFPSGLSPPQAATRARQTARNSGRKRSEFSNMGPPGIAPAMAIPASAGPDGRPADGPGGSLHDSHRNPVFLIGRTGEIDCRRIGDPHHEHVGAAVQGGNEVYPLPVDRPDWGPFPHGGAFGERRFLPGLDVEDPQIAPDQSRAVVVTVPCV